jgi:predicted nucleotidyltransferase
MDKKLKTVLAELRRGYEQLYGARLTSLILFGSQARGDAEPGSDIDVLVVLKGRVNAYEEIQRTSQFDADLCMKHSIVIACVYISEEEYLRRQGPLLRNVRREGVLV